MDKSIEDLQYTVDLSPTDLKGGATVGWVPLLLFMKVRRPPAEFDIQADDARLV
jgi:hypothetical protein